MTIIHRGAGLVTGLLTALVTLLAAPAPADAAGQTPWHAQYFPNVELTTHNGARVHFYDLIKGKTVAIELIYTTCQFACPLETARLAQVQALLGDRMGRDVFFYSITIDPVRDTPAALKAFAEKYHAGPGWTFLTGTPEDIELLSKKLGLYSSPDPDNKDGHIPALLIGNEKTGQWIRGSALDNPKMSATMIAGWVGIYPAAAPIKSYAEAKPIPKLSPGQYVFSTKCSACHTLGQGSRIGPDLAGITLVRDRQWLAKYIAGPDEMLKAGDPAAKALLSQYKQMRMPNLGLSDQQVSDVIAYLDGIRPAHQQ
jgi:protein SCO1/2